MAPSIPAQAVSLGFEPGKYHMGDQVSFRGPCISCGGSRRMVVFVDGSFPSWWLRCDLCGIEGWLDNFFSWQLLQDIKKNQPSNGTEVFDHKREEQAVSRLMELQASGKWRVMHDRMDEGARGWWREQGIPDSWQDFWQLGFLPSIQFKSGENTYERPAYSIPKFDFGWEITNVDYRIIDPPITSGKYRSEYGVPASFFISRPDYPGTDLLDRVVVVEGSKKAMLLSLHLSSMLVLGVPGSRSWAKVEQLLKDGPEVIVVLDPDAEQAARKLVGAIGRNAGYLLLPTKPDDAFVSYGLTEERFWHLVRRNLRKDN